MKKQAIKILFDASSMVNGARTGVGRTTEGLVLSLARAYPNELILVGHYFDFMGRKDKVALPKTPNIRYRRTVLVPGRVFNMLRRIGFWVPFELLVKEKGDFHLFPGFIGWPSLFRTPSAPFVHDITYIEYPQYVNGPARYDLKSIMPRTLKRSSFVITNSNSTRLGLLREYPHSAERMIVEHIPPVNTVRISPAEASSRLKRLGIAGPYILFFGTLEPRKNLVSLLDAYGMLKPSLRNKYSLVVGGGKGWKDDEIIRSMRLSKEKGARILQTGYVSDKDRAALFMGASMYVMPSHYEGFGMQLLEAMTYGTPPIVSNIPVLHEVGQEAALYADTDPKSIADAITHLAENKGLRQDLIRKGKERLSQFSWDIVASELYEIIVRVVRPTR